MSIVLAAPVGISPEGATAALTSPLLGVVDPADVVPVTDSNPAGRSWLA